MNEEFITMSFTSILNVSGKLSTASKAVKLASPVSTAASSAGRAGNVVNAANTAGKAAKISRLSKLGQWFKTKLGRSGSKTPPSPASSAPAKNSAASSLVGGNSSSSASPRISRPLPAPPQKSVNAMDLSKLEKYAHKPLPQPPVKTSASTPVSSSASPVTHVAQNASNPVPPTQSKASKISNVGDHELLMRDVDQALQNGKGHLQKLQQQIAIEKPKVEAAAKAEIDKVNQIGDALSRPLELSSRAVRQSKTTGGRPTPPPRPARFQAQQNTSTGSNASASSRQSNLQSLKTELLNVRKNVQEQHRTLTQNINTRLQTEKDPAELKKLMLLLNGSQRKANVVRTTNNLAEANKIANMSVADFLKYEKTLK